MSGSNVLVECDEGDKRRLIEEQMRGETNRRSCKDSQTQTLATGRDLREASCLPRGDHGEFISLQVLDSLSKSPTGCENFHQTLHVYPQRCLISPLACILD